MSLTAIVDLITAAALVFGVVFGAVQLRHLRDQRRVQSDLELLHSYQTPEFVRGFILSWRLPEGLPMQEIESRLGEDMRHLYFLMATWESLGVLVHRRDIPLELVEDFFSGAIVVSWRSLRTLVEAERQLTSRDTAFEWFQWLAERILEREAASLPVPAYIEHAKWRA
jgi:hypothetical protein